MSKRSQELGFAIAWLIGTIILAVKIPFAKIGTLLSRSFIGEQAVLTNWTVHLFKNFAKDNATISQWVFYTQWILFLVVLGLIFYWVRSLACRFHMAKRDEDEALDNPTLGMINYLSMGLVWSVATIVGAILVMAIASTGNAGSLRYFIFDLARHKFDQSGILLGIIAIALIITFLLMANRNIWTIFKKEMSIYLTTPIAYVVMMLFSILSGYFFTLALSNFERYSTLYRLRFRMMAQFNLNDIVFAQILNVFGVILLFLIPILTMRLIAEEKRNSTFELMMTSPLTTLEIVLGKYLSVLVALSALLGITLLYPLMVGIMAPGSFEWAPIFTGYFGMYLLASALAAIGLLCSSLTENQIIAAVVSFGILLLLWVIESAAGRMGDGWARETVSYLSILVHLKNFVQGVVASKDVIYYLSLIFFANFLTYRIVESQRWR